MKKKIKKSKKTVGVKTKKKTIRKKVSVAKKIIRKPRRKAKKTSPVASVARKITRRFGKTIKSRKRRKHGAAMGSRSGGIASQKPMDLAINMGIALAAAIAGSMGANKIPVANSKIKAAIPLVAGLGLGMSKYGRKPKIMAAAIGLSIAGGLALVNQFKPGLTTLAGDDTVFLPNNMSGPEMLVISEELNGELDGEIDGELDGELDGEIDGELDGEIDGELDGEIDGEMFGDPWVTASQMSNM